MTTKLELTHGYYALVDDEDYDYLNQWSWQVRKIKHTINHDLYYAARTHYLGTKNGKKIEKNCLMHRLIMGAKKGEIIDHINNDGLDNRKSNLKIVTHRENQLNRVQKTSSKCPGVYYDKNKKRYRCIIVVNNKKQDFGRFKNEKDACERSDEVYSYIKLGKEDEIPPSKFKRKKTSKYIGVSYVPHTKKWKASKYWNEKNNHLGYYNTEEEAYNAYLKFINNIK